MSYGMELWDVSRPSTAVQCWVIGPDLIEQIWLSLSDFQKCCPKNSTSRPNTDFRRLHKDPVDRRTLLAAAVAKGRGALQHVAAGAA